MRRPSAVFALALAALLSTASTGCSAPAAASRESPSLRDVARSATLLVQPGTLDAQNVHLPALLMNAPFIDPFGKIYSPTCTGVLIHPRVVITAGHCLCSVHPPSPQDKPPPEKSDRGTVLTRAHALRDVVITGILDKRSACAQMAVVFTVAYKPATDGGPTVGSAEYAGPVLIHPEIELVYGKTDERTGVFWNNADLAAIILNQPVPPEIQPLALPDSEVGVGAALVMVGYGTAGRITDALRQSGESEVTGIFGLETGSAILGAVVPPRPDHDAAPVARLGDSGGGCVRKKNPNVLVGIITMQTETLAGTQMTLFTSAFSQKRWLKEIIQRADLAPERGGIVPHSDAGAAPSPQPAAR